MRGGAGCVRRGVIIPYASRSDIVSHAQLKTFNKHNFNNHKLAYSAYLVGVNCTRK